MIYIKLFYNFLLVGLLSFGGGYSAIAIVRDVAKNFDMINDEMLGSFIAISEATPGPLAVNLATFIGAETGGLFGAIIATFAEILPAFVIIIVFTIIFSKFVQNNKIQFILKVVRPSVIGIIMSVGICMAYENIFGKDVDIPKSNVKGIVIFLLLIVINIMYKKIMKNKISTIGLIICGAILGIALNFSYTSYAVTINDVENTNLDNSDKLVNSEPIKNTIINNIKNTDMENGMTPDLEIKINEENFDINIGMTKASMSQLGIYEHDGKYYMTGEDKGKFSLTGYCACNKCGTGTGITASGHKVRENHTVASDWKVLPKGTMIILKDAVGKDGQVYDGVYEVEDRGGGVKNNHIDIYRPTHELAAMVTHYGRAYGNVFLAVPLDIASFSNIKK